MRKENKTEKSYLLISTLPEDSKEFNSVHKELLQHVGQLQAISTSDMKIKHCIGCNDCWIKTPGLCCIKDDYEQILIKMLQADCVIFLTETKLGFVCSQMKNLVDRILPLATMHLKFKDGQMRHYSRYGRQPDMALLYTGDVDHDYLNLWLDRVNINLHSRSLGTYKFENREGFYNEINNY